MTTQIMPISPDRLVNRDRWDVFESGPLSARDNMDIDRAAMADMEAGRLARPRLRLFGWTEASVTFGYLLNEALVQRWARRFGNPPVVRRPTGGGAVFHEPGQVSFSLLFLKGDPEFPSHPRDLYEAVHARIFRSLKPALGGAEAALFVKQAGSCDQKSPPDASGRFSACFSEPVCNDIMLNGKKILGGALRVARASILYQGTLHLP